MPGGPRMLPDRAIVSRKQSRLAKMRLAALARLVSYIFQALVTFSARRFLTPRSVLLLFSFLPDFKVFFFAAIFVPPNLAWNRPEGVAS
jgi:UDP-N-acetylmuramyl pentapeptide phosphotransferase/UDP-N-acetylglucosamine-1-phosphate transferase